MRIYLAARYERRKDLLPIASTLRGRGHEITSRWINGQYDNIPRSICALDDVEDIDRADAIILLSGRGDDSLGHERGGRHFELGYAYGKGKFCVVLGERENVFHHHPNILVSQDLEDVMEKLEFAGRWTKTS